SYAIGAFFNGPANTRILTVTNGNGTSQVMLIWEHSRDPGCVYTTGTPPVSVPWPLNDVDAPNHYPEYRHSGVYNVVFCYAHVTSIKIPDLQIPMFYCQ